MRRQTQGRICGNRKESVTNSLNHYEAAFVRNTVKLLKERVNALNGLQGAVLSHERRETTNIYKNDRCIDFFSNFSIACIGSTRRTESGKRTKPLPS